jgi:hypothetical protein
LSSSRKGNIVLFLVFKFDFAFGEPGDFEELVGEAGLVEKEEPLEEVKEGVIERAAV